MGTLYVLDDSFQISEEVKRMSDEERHQRIKILEEEGRRERENIRANNHRKSLQSNCDY